jgi:glycine/D-amino acid oxidase-like deaminating enzyme
VSGADVVVFGATATGVTAAVAASEAGASVLLVAPDRYVGGMVSGGVSWSDLGDTRVIGGVAQRFHEAVADHYEAPLWAVKGPEPHVAERLLVELLERAGVDVRLGEPLVQLDTTNGSITALRTERGRAEAAVFVDAGYEGDLMAAAGIPYAVGREPRASCTAKDGRAGNRRRARASTTFPFSCRRSTMRARWCRSCASPSSTGAAGRRKPWAPGTAGCRLTGSACA